MNEHLRVLFINPGRTAYGSGQSMLNLLHGCSLQAQVVCTPAGPLHGTLEKMGIKVYPMEFSRYAFARNPLWHFAFYTKFKRILAKSHPDVVVINLDGNTPLVTIAAVRAGIPIVRFSRFEFQPPRRWIDKYCWRKASAVICPTQLVRHQVSNWAPESLKKSVHCFYDPHLEHTVTAPMTQRFRSGLGLENFKTIGFFGRLHRGKRIETAIRALPSIHTKQPGTHLIIVGAHDGSASGAAYENELHEIARKTGVQNEVHFLGYLDHLHVPTAMSACDVTLLPSESESFGMVLTESWALQIPTVASDVSGCREITKASRGGFLVPVGDHDALAKQTIALLSNTALARSLGISGQNWVKANCSLEVYAERFHHLLQKVTGIATPNQSNRSSIVASFTEEESISDPPTQPFAPKKICVATFYHEAHPGAVLQAFALAKTLERFGYRAEMLAYRRPIRHATSSRIKSRILKIVARTARKNAEYADFRSKFLNETRDNYLSHQAIVAHPPEANAYVCGSDQIWNPRLLRGDDFDPAYFLQFGSQHVRRFSYAASFGGFKPDFSQGKALQKYLKDFSHISVREPAAQVFLTNLLGRKVELTLDPTLLFDGYRDLLPASGHDQREKYILCYALQNSPELHATVKTVASYFNMPARSFGGPFLPWKRMGGRIEERGPLYWLNLIKNAQAVVTNSFHGLVFALMFRKRVLVPPLVGEQQERNERLFHLCDMLEVRRTIIATDVRHALKNEIPWESLERRLAEARESSMLFLRSALQ